MSDSRNEHDSPIICCTREADGKILTMLSSDGNFGVPHFGLLVCDIVRHVAKAFNVPESKVWYWVEKERGKPTTSITQLGRG